MKFPPWLSLYFRVSGAIFAVIVAAAQGSPEHFGGKVFADDLTFWLALLVTVQQTIFSFGGTGNQTSLSLAGPVK